jgi:hypothetical protein
MVHSLTIPPESDPEGPELAQHLMRGRTPEICLAQYNNAKRLLARRLIKTILEKEELEPSLIEMLKNDLKEIGDIELVDLGEALGRPAIYISNSTTPGPPSARLHAEFVRMRASQRSKP